MSVPGSAKIPGPGDWAVHWQNGTEDSNCTEDPEFPATVTDLEAKCTESSILLKVTWSNLREQPIWRIGGEQSLKLACEYDGDAVAFILP